MSKYEESRELVVKVDELKREIRRLREQIEDGQLQRATIYPYQPYPLTVPNYPWTYPGTYPTTFDPPFGRTSPYV